MTQARWVFYFDEGNIVSDTFNETQEMLITDALESGNTPIICVPVGKMVAYINLAKIKCVTCEDIEPEVVE